MALPQWMFMADPIHGIVRLKRHNENHRMLLDIMNSRAFQRLRRIKQMGMAEFVFPGASHTRFVHSVGAAWLMVKTLDHLMEYPDVRALLKSTFEDTKITLERLLLASILVHDIGHTPLSHTFEDILNLGEQGLLHDVYWNRLILENDEELQVIWKRYGTDLPQAICRFIGVEGQSERHFLADLVSSQLDMDRLDYLLRDSHYLGVQYGRIEVDRIISNLTIGVLPTGEKAVAIQKEAVPAVEHYLFGRYEAYKMALHSLDKAAETLLKKTLERFRWVRDQGLDAGHPAELLYTLIRDGKSLSVDDYLMLDDCYLWDKVNLWARFSEDLVLRDLSNRLLGHNLFKYVEIAPFHPHEHGPLLIPVLAQLRQYYDSRGLSFEYGFEALEVAPKPLYQTAPIKPPIWIQTSSSRPLVDFSEVSALPLHQEVPHSKRCLLFVWDRDAKVYLKKLVDQHLGPS